jgi:hypothetical protein
MAEAASWYVEHAVIPEQVVPGRRLGRVVRHDSRNRLYPWQRQDRQLTSQLWTRHIPILDQGQLGSCTGNAEVGALGCDPDFGALPPSPPLLNEDLAVALYSAAEKIDGGAGYPPEDEGSSGPSAAQAAVNRGLISGYVHCFSLADVLDALEDHPVCLGVNWYTGFDRPDSSGHVSIGSGDTVRGGHEFLCRGKDTDAKIVICDNSWGTGWGKAGNFSFSWADLDRLLHEQGDATISLPLTQPAPAPVPVPVPVPASSADLTLFRQTQPWTAGHHVGQSKAVAANLRAWYAAKGFR